MVAVAPDRQERSKSRYAVAAVSQVSGGRSRAVVDYPVLRFSRGAGPQFELNLTY